MPSWGVDFLKVDCISQPYDAPEIHMVSAALKRSGRPIVLSLSPGPTPIDQAADVRQYAQMWRISDDMWDLWEKKPGDEAFPQSLKNQFHLLSEWSPHVEPGHWPDADMLPIGYLGPRPGWGSARQSRFTLGEYAHTADPVVDCPLAAHPGDESDANGSADRGDGDQSRSDRRRSALLGKPAGD